jgi:hypothetical protein
MVALNRTQIPSSIITVEQMSAWCCAVLTNLHFQQEILEAPNLVQKVAVSQTFPISYNGGYQMRHVGRVSLPISDASLAGGKVWEHVGVLSSASIPTEFTT